MPALTVLIGFILSVTGVTAYVASDNPHFTALIPVFIGVLLIAAGLIARKENLRPHAMHAALLVALLGAGGSVSRTFPLYDGDSDIVPIASTITFVLLVVLLVAGIRSFIAARAARRAA